MKTMPLDSPHDLNYPRFASLLEMHERDSRGEEQRRKIELGFERKEGEERKHTKNIESLH